MPVGFQCLYVPVVQVDFYKNYKLFSDFFMIPFNFCIHRVLLWVTQQQFALVIRLIFVMREIFPLVLSCFVSHSGIRELQLPLQGHFTQAGNANRLA